MPTDVKVPALGESITEATLGQWLKAPGEAVAADEPIASLETDKVAIEVNAPVAGTLAEQLVKEGDTVEVGAIIARLAEGASGDSAGGSSQSETAAAADAAPAKEIADAGTNPAGPAETPLPRVVASSAHAIASTTLSTYTMLAGTFGSPPMANRPSRRACSGRMVKVLEKGP